MDSYLEAPAIHAECVKNPRMLGGPFMDYAVDRSGEIKDLRDTTVMQRARLIDLSQDIATVNRLLSSEAKGFSLEPLYARLPESLKGYVELVYDLNRQPSFRLLESLLYRSQFYDPSAQSFMMSCIDSDDRPFALSTPRLDEDGHVHFRLPFKDETVDALFAMTTRPNCISQIAEMGALSAREHDSFAAFTTSQAPVPYVPYRGSGLRWRYFGHACILLETRTLAALFDPVISYTYRTNLHRYTHEDLPERLDFAFITHNHQDHMLFETLLRLRSRIGTIVVPRSTGGSLSDPSLKVLLNQCGFRSVLEIGELEELQFDGGTVTGIPFLGEHGDLDIRTKLGYLLRTDQHTLLFAADSRNLEPDMYTHLHNVTGDVDILFIGMECDGAPLSWVYGPLLTSDLDRAMDHSRRLAGSNCEQALAMVERLHCKQVYVYAMGQEPWLNYVMCIKYGPESRPIIESNRLIKECLRRGIEAERLFGEKEICLAAPQATVSVV
jgi:L-ascorbate metabolism protein UlaG (beta-lactamase superfamily)